MEHERVHIHQEGLLRTMCSSVHWEPSEASGFVYQPWATAQKVERTSRVLLLLRLLFLRGPSAFHGRSSLGKATGLHAQLEKKKHAKMVMNSQGDTHRNSSGVQMPIQRKQTSQPTGGYLLNCTQA